MSSAAADAGEPGLRLVLADDHAVVRAGLRLLLDSEPGWEVVAECGDTDAAIRSTRAYKPDVLVLDLNMDGGSSLRAIDAIGDAAPDTRVVILTMQADPASARAALRAGALGYVLKEAAQEELVTAIKLASEGEIYLNPRLGAKLASLPDQPARPDELSARESEVLTLIAHGYTNAEVGARLFLSVRTVESHRAAIQRKTGRSKRSELVQYALDHGLFEDSQDSSA